MWPSSEAGSWFAGNAITRLPPVVCARAPAEPANARADDRRSVRSMLGADQRAIETVLSTKDDEAGCRRFRADPYPGHLSPQQGECQTLSRGAFRFLLMS